MSQLPTREALLALLPQVEALARSAGELIAREAATFTSEKIETKGRNDFVSYVDRAAEKLILEGLQALPLNAGILSEEGGGTMQPEGLNWIVDPLDGTTNFIHSFPLYAVSIGLAMGSDILLGVIYDASNREMFSAVKGEGAYLMGKPIKASTCNKLENALIATGFPCRDYDRINEYFDSLNYLMRNSHGVRRLGSAALDLAYVACGRADAFYEYGLHAWDVAAGLLIAHEAGCQSCDFAGGDNYLFGGELVTAVNPLYDSFACYIRSVMKR